MRLLLPSDEFVLVDPGSSHDEIAARYDLDRVELVPDIRVFGATYLDGPFQGDTNPYVQGEIGAHISVSTPTPSGRRLITYELVELPAGDEPGKLRHVS